MTARAEELRNQVQGLWHQAVVGLEGIKDKVVRTATERLDVDARKLQQRRDRLFARVGSQALHFAQDSKVPLPAMVKGMIVRLGSLAESLAGTPAKTAKASRSDFVQQSAAPAGRANGNGNGTGHNKPQGAKRQGQGHPGHRTGDQSTGKPSGQRSRRSRRPAGTPT